MMRVPIGRHYRSIRRALLKVGRRQIRPLLALQLIVRSTWRMLHAAVVVALLLCLAAMVLLAMCSNAAIGLWRGYSDLARSKAGKA